METIIITTDFSAASTHAARYAASLSQILRTKNIILYHSYEIPPVSTEIPLPEMENPSLSEQHSIAGLDALLSEIKPLINEQATIITVSDDQPLTSGIIKLQQQYRAELIVAGMTGKSGIEKVFVGSNTIKLIQNAPTNLLVVPHEAQFVLPKNAVFACDFNLVDQTTPVETLYQLVHRLNVQLLILNVAKPEARFDPDMIPEQFKLHELLDHLHPQYHYTEHNDTAEGIMEFAEAAQAQFVITVPKVYGFFESLFHRSVTKKLAHHTRLPLFLLK